MKIHLSHLIAADRFMDRCGLSLVNNLVNSILKIYLRCTGQECLKGKGLKHEWSMYVQQKDVASCAAGLIPGLGTIVIVARERFKEKRAEETLIGLDGRSLEDLNATEKEELSHNPKYADYLIYNGLVREVRFDQLYKSGDLQRIENPLKDSVYGPIGDE